MASVIRFPILKKLPRHWTHGRLHMLKPLSFSELLLPLDARRVGEDARFNGVSIDSRAINPGQLFVALTGPRFDGHDYLDQVAAKGAVGALVEREIPGSALPQLIVGDTRKALAQLGAMNRNAFIDKPVAAITGSSGKTTVKEMLASILRTRGSVLATRGNLNNELGVPLTLLELAPEFDAAVIELGASRVGEIAFTVSLTKPHVVVLTNAGTAHVGEFGGPEKIVEAKGEIIEGLDARGVAVLNRDDKAFDIWVARTAGRKVLSFSRNSDQADFYATDLGIDARGCPTFTLNGPSGSAQVQLNLLGAHNVANALAAAAAGHALGVSLPGLVAGLDSVQPVKGRTVAQLATNGMRVIDDTYNANPTSVAAATDILAGFAGRTVLVLGDIGELGDWAEQGHRDVGAYAAGKVDALYAVGPLMAHAVKAFGQDARHFANQADLIEALGAEQDKNTTILIKGSRSAAMENVVAALCGSSLEKH
jgi:UDP-N-acetylmuramoyl-tripeptide--D-alanyl-D-alanine ligase